MNEVRPKKSLGQHFLTDQNIAKQIVEQLSPDVESVIEVGAGTGVLTQYLVQDVLHHVLGQNARACTHFDDALHIG